MDASVNRIPSSKDEKALLVALRLRGEGLQAVEYSLAELELLVRTAGAVIVESRIVSRSVLDASTIVGRGYVETLSRLITEKEIRLIVFDLNNIRPAQVRNLEEQLKCRVVGRTEIILDIFARRARSAEAKIQVELAQLRYILPRLKGLGGVLSRLGGGIGTRGPGEKMLETDRRHVLRRVTALSRKLDKIQRHRTVTRQGRSGEVQGAVVGYTNAGKSTLVNVLARDDLFVEDRLFATLDSYTRQVYLGDSGQVLLSDTVGFIRNLPTNLVESFRSTLEEIGEADFLVHVVDAAAPDLRGNIDTVERELADLDALGKPVILFFNKADLVIEEALLERITATWDGAIVGSAIAGRGIDELRARMADLRASLASARITADREPENISS